MGWGLEGAGHLLGRTGLLGSFREVVRESFLEEVRLELSLKQRYGFTGTDVGEERDLKQRRA